VNYHSSGRRRPGACESSRESDSGHFGNNTPPPSNTWRRGTRASSIADWKNYHDLAKDYPSADRVGDCVVFNILRNDFRLIARLRFRSHKVFILKVMTHAEYDRNDWQSECGCHQRPPSKKKKAGAAKKGRGEKSRKGSGREKKGR
jgi:mRNA interferase HigB